MACGCGCCEFGRIFQDHEWNLEGDLQPILGFGLSGPTRSIVPRAWTAVASPAGFKDGQLNLDLGATRIGASVIFPSIVPHQVASNYFASLSASLFDDEVVCQLINRVKAGTAALWIDLSSPAAGQSVRGEQLLSVNGSERRVTFGTLNQTGLSISAIGNRTSFTATNHLRYLPIGIAAPEFALARRGGVSVIPAVTTGVYRTTPPSGIAGIDGNLSNKLTIFRDSVEIATVNKNANNTESLSGLSKHSGTLQGAGHNSTVSTAEFVADGHIRVYYQLIPSTEGVFDVGKLIRTREVDGVKQFLELDRASGIGSATVFRDGEAELFPGDTLTVSYTKDATITQGADRIEWLLEVVGYHRNNWSWVPQQHFSEDGSYLLRAKYDEDCTYYGETTSHPRYAFASFVLDRVRPVAAVRQWQDFYVGKAAESNNRIVSGSLYSDDYGSSEPLIVPLGLAPQTLSASSAPGTYEREAFRDGEEDALAVTDLAGNSLHHRPLLRVVVHAIPSNGKLGAVATIQAAHGLQLTQDCQDPVETLRVKFDKPVRGLDAETFVLEGRRSGVEEAVAGTIEVERCRGSHTEYLLHLDAEQQTPSSQWTLVFDPDSGIYAMPIAVKFLYLPNKDAFPLPGEPRTVYVAENNQSEWHWVVSEYQSLPTNKSPQFDELTEPVPCVLAAREQWVITSGVGQEAANVAYTTTLIGGYASETVTVTEIDEEVESVTVFDSTIAALQPSIGDYSTSENLPAKIQMPDSADEHESEDGDDAITYFGLPTTIYPSPPLTLPTSGSGPCIAASEQQPHSSAMWGNRNLTALRIKARPFQTDTGEDDFDSYDDVAWEIMPGFAELATTADNEQYRTVSVQFVELSSAGQVPMFDQEFALSATLEGVAMAQNTWTKVNAGSKTFQIRPYLANKFDTHVNVPVPGYGENFGGAASYDIELVGRGGSLTINEVQAAAHVFRLGHTYAGLSTTCAHDLQLRVRFRAACTLNTYENARGTFDDFPGWYVGAINQFQSSEFRFGLPLREWPPEMVSVEVPSFVSSPGAIGEFELQDISNWIEDYLDELGEDRSKVVRFRYPHNQPGIGPDFGVYVVPDIIAPGAATWVAPFGGNNIRIPIITGAPGGGGIGKEVLDVKPGQEITKATPVYYDYDLAFNLTHAQEATIASGGTVTIKTPGGFGPGQWADLAQFHPEFDEQLIEPNPVGNVDSNHARGYKNSFNFGVAWEISGE
jgi:hypothetical protein